MVSTQEQPGFWRQAVALQGSILPRIILHILALGALAVVLVLVTEDIEERSHLSLVIDIAPYEIAGGVLSLILVLRSTAGYERWWEGRKLWGGIVNQSRNLVVTALTLGPADPGWRGQLARWVAAFAHIVRRSLRGERELPEVAALVGEEEAGRIAAANHMPSAAALEIGLLLRRGCDEHGLSGFALLEMERQRATLIDHLGGCERILKSPLPVVYAITIRRFIAGFLITLPFALLHKTEKDWLVPVITMVVAYVLLGLDRIAVELQNPFSPARIGHLPLDDICATIESNVFQLLHTDAERGKPENGPSLGKPED